MKRLIYWTGVSLLAAMVAVSCAPKQNTLTSKEKAEGWQLLFDGTTLNGWRDYNGEALTGPWAVVDGAIQAEGEGSDANGYIVTDKEFTNFDLKWEWKISKGGNSGMMYHVVERPKFSVPYVTGPEYQLIDDDNFTEMPNKSINTSFFSSFVSICFSSLL